MQLPDNGATAMRTDADAMRRRGMLATVMTSASGLGTPASTTAGSTTLGS